MSARKENIDEIGSSTTNPMLIRGKGRFAQDVITADLVSRDVPSWANVLAIIPVPTPIVVDVTAGDSQPLVIPHPDFTWPSVMYRNADGSRYGGATDSDDGSNLTITGDADDTGAFADSFTVIVKG